MIVRYHVRWGPLGLTAKESVTVPTVHSVVMWTALVAAFLDLVARDVLNLVRQVDTEMDAFNTVSVRMRQCVTPYMEPATALKAGVDIFAQNHVPLAIMDSTAPNNVGAVMVHFAITLTAPARAHQDGRELFAVSYAQKGVLVKTVQESANVKTKPNVITSMVHVLVLLVGKEHVALNPVTMVSLGMSAECHVVV